jgi:hypothetical protein
MFILKKERKRNFSILQLDFIRMGLKLTGERTRSATEFGIIFVITVIAFHNQSAVGKVLVVGTISWYVEACN